MERQQQENGGPGQQGNQQPSPGTTIKKLVENTRVSMGIGCIATAIYLDLCRSAGSYFGLDQVKVPGINRKRLFL